MSKKFISKILVLIILIINLSQISLATITETENKGNINISNIEEGTKVTLYKIANIEYDYTNNQPIEGYIWENKVKQWINTNYPEYIDTEEFYNQIQSDSEDAQVFYDKLVSEIKKGKILLPKYASMNTIKNESETGSLKGVANFSNIEMGTYLIIIENGYKVYTPSVINVVPVYKNNEWIIKTQEIVIKSTSPQITKMVTNGEKIKDNYSTADIITYIIEADVPKYLENSIARKYCISDKIDDSLEINIDSVKIYALNEQNEAEQLFGHTINWNSERLYGNTTDIMTFFIDFEYSNISEYNKIRIEYDARLKQNAIIGQDGNNNYAYLDYSNNPYDVTSIQSQSAGKVTIYTYDIEIKSVDTDGVTPLAKSEYILKDEQNNELYFILKDDGKYYLAKSEDDGAIKNLKVDGNGMLYLYGLDDGTYTIKQTKAPDGYNISNKTYEINIVDNEPDGILDKENSFIIKNTKGFTLPLTGGRGTTVIIALSVILLGSGVIMLIFMNKK